MYATPLPGHQLSRHVACTERGPASCPGRKCVQASCSPLCCPRRLAVYKAFKEGQKRILVATDLIGRGIDIERVNIVINYDMPETDEYKGNGADTYLHRVSCCPRLLSVTLAPPLRMCKGLVWALLRTRSIATVCRHACPRTRAGDLLCVCACLLA